MRKATSRLIFGIAAAVFAATLTSASNNDNIMTKEKGMIIVNTTELTRDVKGFKGSTPVKIYIKKKQGGKGRDVTQSGNAKVLRQSETPAEILGRQIG